MRIAFTSCFDVKSDLSQPIWTAVLAHSPDVLLLLGDSIYMDYWPKLNEPRGYSASKFAASMYDRYRQQWGVHSFRELVGSVKHIGVIWDDHDFAWNGACGMPRMEHCVWSDTELGWVCTPTSEPQPSVDLVPPEKQSISYALFQQFKSVLRAGDSQAPYPEMPSLDVMLATPNSGIEECFDIGGVRFILLDGRSYREPLLDSAHPGLLLGKDQQDWLARKAEAHPGLKVICSGTALKRGSESWDRYRDYEWLMQEQTIPNAIVISGDIHYNACKVHKHDKYRLPEATASGAALPLLGGGSGNFGLLDVDDGVITHLLLCDSDETLPYGIQASNQVLRI